MNEMVIIFYLILWRNYIYRIFILMEEDNDTEDVIVFISIDSWGFNR